MLNKLKISRFLVLFVVLPLFLYGCGKRSQDLDITTGRGVLIESEGVACNIYSVEREILINGPCVNEEFNSHDVRIIGQVVPEHEFVDVKIIQNQETLYEKSFTTLVVESQLYKKLDFEMRVPIAIEGEVIFEVSAGLDNVEMPIKFN
jgi:hypothetical protein